MEKSEIRNPKSEILDPKSEILGAEGEGFCLGEPVRESGSDFGFRISDLPSVSQRAF